MVAEVGGAGLQPRQGGWAGWSGAGAVTSGAGVPVCRPGHLTQVLEESTLATSLFFSFKFLECS